MSQSPHFDVAVIGAGPLGSAAARHLADQNASVVVIGPDEPTRFDDHEGVWAGYYDQGRLAHVLEVPLVTSLMATRSRRRFAALAERTGVEFTVPTHSLSVFPDFSGAPASTEWFDRDRLLRNAEDLGVEVEPLTLAQMHLAYPDLRIAPGHVGIVQRDALVLNPRELVRAELAAATASGAVLVRDEITAVDTTDRTTVRLTAISGNTWRADEVVVATGAATNALGLLPRPLDMQAYGATVVLVEVHDPDSVDMPAMMYLQAVDGELGFGGIVMSPLRYPDGKWYIKVSGRSLMDNPLDTTAQIAQWVRTGGRKADVDEALTLLTDLLPDQQFGRAHTRPCMVCETPTGLPYIDRADERTTVLVEGERGAMAADEIGRLAADLTLSGRWRDGIPHAPLQLRWAKEDATGSIGAAS